MIKIEYAPAEDAERPDRESREVDDSKWETLLCANNYREAVDDLVDYLNDCDETVDVGVMGHWFRWKEITT